MSGYFDFNLAPWAGSASLSLMCLPRLTRLVRSMRLMQSMRLMRWTRDELGRARA